MTFKLAASDITVSRAGRRVVTGVSLSVRAASWFGIVGANGSGKTSLLRALAGRLPIAAGRIVLDELDVSADRSGRARRIGFAPPIDGLPAVLTVREGLAMATDDFAAMERRCGVLWAALGISAMLPKRIGECSSGMRQRVAIALAFSRPVSIAIIDEPFNWLDAVVAYDLKGALADHVSRGLTLITALQDLTSLSSCCSEGVLLANGQLALKLSEDDLRAGRAAPMDFEDSMIVRLRNGA